jgi:hypothetical protein
MNLGLGLFLSSRGPLTPAYNPVTALGNVVLWLRPDLGLTQSGGLVTAWADQSGVGDANRNFAPVNDKPAFSASDALYNNQPTIGTFNTAGTDNSCRLKSAAAWSATYTTFSLIIVGHATGSGIRYFSSSTAGDRLSILKSTAAGNVAYLTGVGTEVGVTAVSTATPRLMIAEVNGGTPANGKMYADSVSASTAMNASGSLGAAPFVLGTYMGANLATTWGVDRIAEVLVISGLWSALSAQQKSDYAAYINTRYGKAIT